MAMAYSGGKTNLSNHMKRHHGIDPMSKGKGTVLLARTASTPILPFFYKITLCFYKLMVRGSIYES